MKLTILYPCYFPGLLWWQKVYAADYIVVLDDRPNPRLGHLNRCYIKSDEGKLGLSIPVIYSKKIENAINKLKVDPTKNWFRTHPASLISNYSNAPYFEPYYPCFADFYARHWRQILDIYMESGILIVKLLRLKKQFHFHSQFPTSGSKENRVMQLLELFNCNSYIIEAGHKNYFNSDKLKKNGYNIENIYQNNFGYEQQFGSFIPGLSILDCLFNEGPYVLKFIQGRSIYKDQ